MDKILLFGGTTEGRTLACLKVAYGDPSVELHVAIATDYGSELLPPEEEGFSVHRGRMEAEEMVDFIRDHQIDKIIDATHPYAALVSGNIRNAGEKTGTPVVRLAREEEDIPGDCITVESTGEAAAFLAGTEGPVLLTTGSKELSAYTVVPDFAERLFPRMLPDPEMIQKTLDMGYKKQNLICMQGPFGEETNLGILKQIGAKYMVTKEAGKAGGFPEKIAAAQRSGVKVVLICRPPEGETVSFGDAAKLCGIELQDGNASIGVICGDAPGEGLTGGTKTLMDSRFPMYVDVKDMPVLVVGGGKIAMRRAKVLRDFQCRIKVVAKEVREDDHMGMDVRIRAFEEGDLEGAKMVVAATDDHGLNARIGELCREREIPVNVASDRKLCDFYFPGIVRAGNVTVGVIAGGRDHKKAARIRERIERLLHEEESDCR